ncbi:hypothetical protein PJV94_00450 [Aliarcobacter butzleri]|uniref:hypothetical protein n=1 Tax=Aliarcobacter butzleri TaxID=28197 RepID=UPI00263D6E2C|nr:hypothetical protein [Aliarcobacter butzleri]MDN5071973.1 hypothetical protein [Aliarcobacter butzleri]MDN5120147.1 hypothetical protein [Aliarcobacter butzleri]MDN5129505.1 hypothetical protein [Aliarcobacter butzleri]
MEDNIKLFDKRLGGSIAIRGFEFQFLYSCYSILMELTEENLTKKIGLERLEDLDIIYKNEYVQLKTSLNNLDANFFIKTNILKNFLNLYQYDKNVNFKLVHNSNISDGNLKKLQNKNIDNKTLEYWTKKISELDRSLNIDVKDFLSRISFEKTTEKELYSKSKKLILEKFNLTIGSEEPFLFSLLHHILLWSKDRKEVTYTDLLKVIQLVKDSASKTSTLEAINKNYISKISFNKKIYSNNLDNYFDGKSARPEHIINELPIRRKFWEDKIIENLLTHDVLVIKASSGQGKSTLAWQSSKIFEGEYGFNIYQLNYCDNETKVEELYDFFLTRLEIGELPLIVIDGLNKNLEKYALLLERLYGFSIKVIITVREEDWNRYKPDISKYDLSILNINLLENEAKEIFEELKNKNRIFKDINTWQPSWEKVKDKALLIEYIYLLTHGTMLKDRLDFQIKLLMESEEESVVKTEILRIVSLADILNIKIQTKKLTKYIQDNIGFKSDRERIYTLLEKEYFIKFDNKYIEGLHPVRSEHLLKILHNFISVEETAINLLKIIDDKFIYDYFILISNYIDSDVDDFFEEISKIISQKDFSMMVEAIDGLMHFETYNYWLKNKEIFDEVYEKGFVNLFIMDTVPFVKPDIIKNSNNIVQTPVFEYLRKKLDNLSVYETKNSNIYKFVLKLSHNITNFTNQSLSYDKVNFLIKWFRQLDINFKQFFEFDEKDLLNILQNEKIEESRALFNFLYTQNIDKYNDFIGKNKNNIFSILKIKTNSLVIKEIDEDIKIEYLIDNEKAEKLNECSMERINIIYDFFPDYTRYCTEALYLPFPNEDIYKGMIQNSIKHIPNENLYHDFDTHINRLWIDTIEYKYSYETVYEWQQFYFELRKKSVDYFKKLNKVFELVICKNKAQNKADEIDDIFLEISSILKLKKSFPFSLNKKKKRAFENEIKNISDYIGSFQNILNQISSLVKDRFSQDSNLAVFNLKDLIKHLFPMQNSFNEIQKNTSIYFDFKDIEIEEEYWINRLLKTINFYRYTEDIKSSDIKNQIEEWTQIRRKKELDNIHNILDVFKIESNFEIIYPKSVIEDGNFREIVVGIKDMNEYDFEKVVFGLVDFHKIEELTFVNIINVINNYATFAFRIPITYLFKVKHLLETDEYEEDEFGNPYPINLTEELLFYLNEKIYIQKVNFNKSANKLIKILFDIWELTEYRKYLNKNSDIEFKWLKEIEKDYTYKIKNEIDESLEKSSEIINNILENKINVTKENILEIMNTIVNQKVLNVKL